MQRPEVMLEMDYDMALDVMANYYSVGRVHCHLAEMDHFLPLSWLHSMRTSDQLRHSDATI